MKLELCVTDLIHYLRFVNANGDVSSLKKEMSNATINFSCILSSSSIKVKISLDAVTVATKCMKINREITKVKRRDAAVRQEEVRRNVGGTWRTNFGTRWWWVASLTLRPLSTGHQKNGWPLSRYEGGGGGRERNIWPWSESTLGSSCRSQPL